MSLALTPSFFGRPYLDAFDSLNTLDLFDRLSRSLAVFPKTSSILDKSFYGSIGSLDLTDSDDKYVLEVDVPGFKAEDLKIDYDEQTHTLTVSGKQKDSKKKQKDIHINERVYRAFSRAVYLANDADSSTINASLNDGVLQVTIMKKEPKQLESSVRSIPIC